MSESNDQLKILRDRLDEIDAGLVELAARRQQLVSEIGRYKQGEQRQLRDFRREREVLGLVRANANRAGLDPLLAEDLFKRLIDASLARQEHERVKLAGRGGGRRALVIGGSGRMGRWLAAFLDNQGYEVLIADPVLETTGNRQFADWRKAPLDAALIVIAAPLSATPEIIAGLAERQVTGLVFDIASLKSPLLGPLRAAADSGLKICSVHPMFGPDTRLLSGRNVLLMDAGNREALNEAEALFADTMAGIVHVPLDEHDRLAALVLGLSHALNIAFFTVLADSGIDAGRLAEVSSTTFERQLDIARDVASENPALYYEIQALNHHGESARNALARAVSVLDQCIESGDENAFRDLMTNGSEYLSALKNHC